jgi:hypothetical protein
MKATIALLALVMAAGCGGSSGGAGGSPSLLNQVFMPAVSRD